MAARTYKKNPSRIPQDIDGFQVNFCKNPACDNFGKPPLESIKGLKLEGSYGSGAGRDEYMVGSGSKKGTNIPAIKCKLCGQCPPIKSNQGIKEEQHRIEAYLNVPRPVNDVCPTVGCANHGVSRKTDPRLYQSIGKSKAGSLRYRCKACHKTFSVKTSTITRQRKSHKNIIVFRCLMNKVPLNRICEIANLRAPALYGKIDFIYNQCQKFIKDQELALREKEFKSLHISSDRQDYLLNWTYTQMKRNIVLNAIGSADNWTGYVFGMHLNFDISLKPVEVTKEAIAVGDYELNPPFRKFARLWLEPDYEKSAAEMRKGKNDKKKNLDAQITEQYGDQDEREDVEACEKMSSEIKLPENGMQVHGEYTMYGHYRFLHDLLKKTTKFRFYLEQESAMRAACLSAFVEEIKDHTAEAFYIRINKDLTIHDKDRLRAQGKRELDDFIKVKGLPPEISETSARLLLIEERINAGEFTVKPPYSDKWLAYPYPARNEAEKMVCWLTDLGYKKHESFYLAKLYSKATLHGIDRFFQQVRRRISLLERAISTSSNAGRKWYGYCPYNPEIIEKLLLILRVYYNYVLAGQDKKTPAMRLGLTSRAMKESDILYYMP